MPETRPPIELAGISFDELEKQISERRFPPVDRWNPPFCGHSGMRIARDGTWYHDDRPIRREAMVRLFSTILRREEDGRHMLVTPVERLEIDVESCAFRAVAMEIEGGGQDRRIALKLDSGDALFIGPDHPLEIVASDHGPSPRVAVRHGLEAELSRPLYYELAELALAESPTRPGVWSCDVFYPLATE